MTQIGALLLGLPECLLGLFQFLDAKALAQLRRSAHMGHGERALAKAAHVAELRAKVLELLSHTKFPFVHAAYVLGLNGSHYSLDTTAERHYGIPLPLPRLLCELFRLEVPDTDFTTLRIQKFASAANFGGSHRTLPVNLHTPFFPDEDGSSSPEPVDCARGPPAYALCLTEGCRGGHGELRKEVCWQRFLQPQAGPSASHWMQFPMDAWLRWYWPSRGDYYVVTATCEPVEFLGALQVRQRKQMRLVGFRLPSPWHEVEEDEEEVPDHREGEAFPTPGRDRSPRRVSGARLLAAKRLLGLINVVGPTVQEIEEAYEACQRQAQEVSSRSHTGYGWDTAQLAWARRVLVEAHERAEPEWFDPPAAPAIIVPEVLALPAP